MTEWIKYGHPFYSREGKNFTGDNLNNPGVLIEINNKHLLIGDVNPLGGVCDDCMGFEDSAITCIKK